jgi:hypothetical protein
MCIDVVANCMDLLWLYVQFSSSFFIVALSTPDLAMTDEYEGDFDATSPIKGKRSTSTTSDSSKDEVIARLKQTNGNLRMKLKVCCYEGMERVAHSVGLHLGKAG